jgi:hypothetical protein
MLDKVSLESRIDASSLLKMIIRHLELYSEIKLDCGCVTKIPNADVVLVEMDNGLHVAVCSRCEAIATDEYNGGTVSGVYNC